MADRGLILRATVQEFKEQARRLSGSTALMTPAQALEALKGVEASGGTLLYGEVTNAAASKEINVGAVLPYGAVWAMVILPVSQIASNYSTLNHLYYVDDNGAVTGQMTTCADTKYDAELTINHANGDITLGGAMQFGKYTYFWLYAAHNG